MKRPDFPPKALTTFVCALGASPPRPLEEGDAIVWVGEPAEPAPAAGRQARFVGDLSAESDRRAALEMAEELFGGPVEVVATGSP